MLEYYDIALPESWNTLEKTILKKIKFLPQQIQEFDYQLNHRIRPTKRKTDNSWTKGPLLSIKSKTFKKNRDFSRPIARFISKVQSFISPITSLTKKTTSRADLYSFYTLPAHTKTLEKIPSQKDQIFNTKHTITSRILNTSWPTKEKKYIILEQKGNFIITKKNRKSQKNCDFGNQRARLTHL